MLVIDNAMVETLLKVEDIIDVLEGAYVDLTQGIGICRPRIDMRLPAGNGESIYQWGTMEGGSSRTGYFAIRMKSDILTEVENNGNRTQEKYCIEPGTFCGLVLLLSVRNGEPLALINDGVLQHMRVSADSAIGVSYGSNEGSSVLGMIGSGGMARGHIEAISAVRDIELVQVYSPTKANRERFAAEMSEKLAIRVKAVNNPEEVYLGADIVSGCTDAVGAVVQGRFLQPGVHVTSIGGRPDQMALSKFDGWLRLAEATVPHNNPVLGTRDEFIYYIASPDDAVWQHHHHSNGSWCPPKTGTRIISLGQILSGQGTVRNDETDITFSERGNSQGAQFHAVAGLIYEKAVACGIGREIPTEWLVQDIRD